MQFGSYIVSNAGDPGRNLMMGVSGGGRDGKEVGRWTFVRTARFVGVGTTVMTTKSADARAPKAAARARFLMCMIAEMSL